MANDGVTSAVEGVASQAANTVASKTGDLLSKGIDADFQKFIVVFILVFGSIIILYILRGLMRFIDVKFINTKMADFKETAGSVMQNNDDHIKTLKELSSKNTEDLKAIQESIRKDFHDQQNGWIKIKGEIYDHVNTMRVDVTNLTGEVREVSKGLPTVQSALEKYQKEMKEIAPRVDGLEKNLSKFVMLFKDEIEAKKKGQG